MQLEHVQQRLQVCQVANRRRQKVQARQQGGGETELHLVLFIQLTIAKLFLMTSRYILKLS